MAIIDFKTNKPLTAREIKRRVMSATGWTSEQYQKQYDILRNKTRNYERATGSTAKIAVNELLYQTTAAQRRYGESYKPSRLVRAIQLTPSVSTGVVQRKGVSRATSRALGAEVLAQFKGLTEKSTEGAEIRRLYELAESGYFETEKARISEEKEAVQRSIEALRARAETLSGAALRGVRRELKATQKQLKKLGEAAEALGLEEQRAPKNVADLKSQLTSYAKSLRAYQDTKTKEWKRKNPDAPADYIVGTP